MKNRHKVIWAEGILLGQQHFQCWDNYHQQSQHFLWETLAPFGVGIKRLELDEAGLSIGQVIIRRCDAIFPNGLIIDYDNKIDSLLSCGFQNSASALIEIYLAVPILPDAKGIAGYSEKTATPGWLSSYYSMSDVYDAQREREVLLARPNLQLLTGDHDRSQFYCLKLLEIMPEGTGKFRSVETFVPCIISLAASPWLMSLLRTQSELLSAKIRLLKQRQQEHHLALPEFNHSDLIDFLLRQLFNQTAPALQFFLVQPIETSPHQYYLALSCFISALSTFDVSNWIIPTYQSEDLRGTFTILDQQLKKLLDVVIPSRMAMLSLQRQSDTTYLVSNFDTVMLTKNSFYLAVSYESPNLESNLEWLVQFVRQVKISAYSQLDEIIATALPGLKISHTQRPPNKLSVKAGYEYFYLEPSGPIWDHIKTEQTLGLFTPYMFSGAKIELVAVQL